MGNSHHWTKNHTPTTIINISKSFIFALHGSPVFIAPLFVYCAHPVYAYTIRSGMMSLIQIKDGDWGGVFNRPILRISITLEVHPCLLNWLIQLSHAGMTSSTYRVPGCSGLGTDFGMKDSHFRS
jgi:hypothetical protein